MRIALLSTCAVATPPKAYGGTELVIAELAKGLEWLGHDVTVFATGDSEPAGTLRYHFDKPMWPPNELSEMRHASFAWREIVHAERFDVVHLNHQAALPFQLLLDLPTVLTIHHDRVEALIAQYRAYTRVSYVAISNRQAALSPELTFARTIHHGLDPDLYEAGAGAGGYVAFLGRFAPEKAPHLAIDAARRAGVPIRLGGAAHEVGVEYFARELKPRLALGDGVAWCGELAHGPKVTLLQGARALLVPLQWEEPFGLVMIEAMLVGTPVIAFARGSAPELVDEGVTGYLVRDADEMAQRIAQLDRIDRARCRARAQERWSHLRMARNYLELYAQLRIDQRPKRGLVRPAAYDSQVVSWLTRGPEQPEMGRVVPIGAATKAARAGRNRIVRGDANTRNAPHRFPAECGGVEGRIAATPPVDLGGVRGRIAVTPQEAGNESDESRGS